MIEVDGSQHFEDEATPTMNAGRGSSKRRGIACCASPTIDVLRQMEGVSVAVMDALGLEV